MTPEAAASTGWTARLELGVALRGGRSVLESRRHSGPLVVQRPFYPEGEGRCHLYLIHPPGGVVSGDELGVRLGVARGASALVTTPAATKIYRSKGLDAVVEQRFTLEAGGALEWLPQETIAFDGARARLKTIVSLEPGARFIGWDIVCLGRRAAGEGFQRGRLVQRLEVWRSGVPLLVESMTLEGGSAFQHAAYGLRGRSCTGTLVTVGAGPETVNALRARVVERRGPGAGDFAATALRGVIVCRYLGDSGERARDLFSEAWEILRPAALGSGAVPPRIWAT
jgi:urease accessory protein